MQLANTVVTDAEYRVYTETVYTELVWPLISSLIFFPFHLGCNMQSKAQDTQIVFANTNIEPLQATYVYSNFLLHSISSPFLHLLSSFPTPLIYFPPFLSPAFPSYFTCFPLLPPSPPPPPPPPSSPSSSPFLATISQSCGCLLHLFILRPNGSTMVHRPRLPSPNICRPHRRSECM